MSTPHLSSTNKQRNVDRKKVTKINIRLKVSKIRRAIPMKPKPKIM